MVRIADARPPREGISFTQFLEQFAPDEDIVEAWFVVRRWPDGVRCAHCDSTRIAERKNRRPQPYWCHDCRRYFSVKTNSVMHCSPLSCQIWVGAVYLMLTSLKGVASTKLARDLGISQKTAWHLGIGYVRRSPMAKTDSCSDRSRSMRPILVVRRSINMPPSATGSGVWAVNTRSLASSTGRLVKFVAKPSTARKRRSCRGIWKRMFVPTRPCIWIRWVATTICHTHTKPYSTAAANMSVAMSNIVGAFE